MLFVLISSAKELLDSILLFNNLPGIFSRTLTIAVFTPTTSAATSFLEAGLDVVP